MQPQYRGVEQLEARRAHNPEVVGSSPASATIKIPGIHYEYRDFSYPLEGGGGIYPQGVVLGKKEAKNQAKLPSQAALDKIK